MHVPQRTISDSKILRRAEIAKVLAELQGGAIDVASEPGKGSTFGLWLPEADEH